MFSIRVSNYVKKKELYIFTNTFYLWFKTIRPYIQNLGQLQFIIFNQPYRGIYNIVTNSYYKDTSMHLLLVN